jgi:hypothetical protein
LIQLIESVSMSSNQVIAQLTKSPNLLEECLYVQCIVFLDLRHVGSIEGLDFGEIANAETLAGPMIREYGHHRCQLGALLLTAREQCRNWDACRYMRFAALIELALRHSGRVKNAVLSASVYLAACMYHFKDGVHTNTVMRIHTCAHSVDHGLGEIGRIDAAGPQLGRVVVDRFIVKNYLKVRPTEYRQLPVPGKDIPSAPGGPAHALPLVEKGAQKLRSQVSSYQTPVVEGLAVGNVSYAISVVSNQE